MIQNAERFGRAVRKIDEVHALDPNRETFEGREHPKEQLYAERMSAWLGRLAPDAPEPLRLAARCQHLRRWEIPRASYPEGRRGYLRWRTRLYRFHAECAAEILRQSGYDESTIARVGDLLSKRGLSSGDPEMQVLEDVICLVFLESYLAEFARRHDEEKLVGILRKTWGKMSPRAREVAGTLPLASAERALFERALAAHGA